MCIAHLPILYLHSHTFNEADDDEFVSDSERRSKIPSPSDTGFNSHTTQGTVSFNETMFFDIPSTTPIIKNKDLSNWYGAEKERGERAYDEHRKFVGYCLDTGAARSLVGADRYVALCKELGHQLKRRPSGTTVKFGSSSFQSRVSFATRINVAQDQFIQLNVDIVNGNIPFLIGLEVMKKYGLTLDFAVDEFRDHACTWTRIMSYHQGHAFISDDHVKILFTKPELQRMHLHFFHPSTGKSFNLIKRHYPALATPTVRSMLDDIGKACSECQE